MSDKIFNMRRLHELKPAPFDEGYIVTRKLQLEVERMKARTEQNGHIPQRHAFFAQLKNLLADKPRLHVLAFGLNQERCFAFALIGKKPLFVTLVSVLDNLVGQIQNRLGAA